MSEIYIGTSKIRSVYVGTQKINKIYVGTACVFSSGFAFTYTGNAVLNGTACTPNTQYIASGSSFTLYFISSGTLTISSLGEGSTFDFFLCGGGSNGVNASHNGWQTAASHSWDGYSYGGAGGAGGKYIRENSKTLSETTYTITIGSNGGESTIVGTGLSLSSADSGYTQQSGGRGAISRWTNDATTYGVTQTSMAGATGTYPFGNSAYPLVGSSGGGGGTKLYSSDASLGGTGAGNGGFGGSGGVATSYGCGGGGGCGGNLHEEYFSPVIADTNGGSGMSGLIAMQYSA